MAYFGKEFVFEKEENIQDFLKGVGTPEESAKYLLSQMKYSQVMEKNGDSYKFIVMEPNNNREIVFKAGVPFSQQVRAGVEAKSTVTVDGDTFTLLQDFGYRGSLVIKREFSPTQLKITYTSSKWDGSAYVYYKAK